MVPLEFNVFPLGKGKRLSPLVARRLPASDGGGLGWHCWHGSGSPSSRTVPPNRVSARQPPLSKRNLVPLPRVSCRLRRCVSWITAVRADGGDSRSRRRIPPRP
jgi:hypothetical protein